MAAESFDHLWQQSREALEQKDWDAARPLLQQALGLKSDSPDLHYNLATVYFQLEDLPSAALHFREVVRLDPLRSGAYINLGAVYNLLDEMDEAVEMLRRGLQLDPHRSEGYYNLGVVYRRKGQRDLAISAYREAIRVNPRMADAYNNLGNLYLSKEEFGLAVEAYRHALQLRPTWERARQGLTKAEGGLVRKGQATPAPKALPATPAPSDVLRTPKPKGLDPERMVDPATQGNLLSNLHRAAIETENHGRTFLKLLEAEIEPAIKELSSCLLHPTGPADELGQCVDRFEKAMNHMRGLQKDLQGSMEKIRTIGEQLIES